MRVPIARSLMAMLFLLTASPAGAADLIGKTVPPYPDGMSSGTGTCVAAKPGLEHACDYAIAVVDDAGGVHRYLIAQRSLGQDGTTPIWRVLDALPYPELRQDEQLAIGTCRMRGREDGSIIAVVAGKADDDYLKVVRQAWRLDVAEKRLTPLPGAGIDCINEAYGL